MAVRKPLVLGPSGQGELAAGDVLDMGLPRTVAGAADTPTVADTERLIVCTSASAVTITANDLGGYRSYGILQAGTGQVTVAAGAAVTLASDKATASYVTARRGAALTIVCNGAGTVFVLGNTA